MDYTRTLSRPEGKNECIPTHVMSPSNIHYTPKADQKIEK